MLNTRNLCVLPERKKERKERSKGKEGGREGKREGGKEKKRKKEKKRRKEEKKSSIQTGSPQEGLAWVKWCWKFVKALPHPTQLGNVPFAQETT